MKLTKIKSLLRRIWSFLKNEFEKQAKKIKAPETPEEIIPEFTDAYQRIFGKDLISMVLYGSGARGVSPGLRTFHFFLRCGAATGLPSSAALRVGPRRHSQPAHPTGTQAGAIPSRFGPDW